MLASFRARRNRALGETLPVVRILTGDYLGITPEPPRPIPEPHSIQKEALEALVRTRAEGNAAGLVPFQLTLVEARS